MANERDLDLKINISKDKVVQDLQSIKQALDDVQSTAKQVGPNLSKGTKPATEETKKSVDKVKQALDQTNTASTKANKAVVSGATASTKATGLMATAIGRVNAGFKLLLTNPLVAVAAAATAAFLTLKKGIQGNIEDQAAINRLNASLAQFGNYSETASKRLSNLAESLELISGKAAPAIMADMARIQQVTGASVDQIEELTKAALDMAVGTGQSFETTSQALTKAFNGQTKVLRQYGIDIKTTGDSNKDFANTISEVNKRFEGQSKNALPNIQRAYLGFTKAFGDFIKGLTDGLSNSIALSAALDTLARVLVAITPAAKTSSRELGFLDKTFIITTITVNKLAQALTFLPQIIIRPIQAIALLMKGLNDLTQSAYNGPIKALQFLGLVSEETASKIRNNSIAKATNAAVDKTFEYAQSRLDFYEGERQKLQTKLDDMLDGINNRDVSGPKNQSKEVDEREILNKRIEALNARALERQEQQNLEAQKRNLDLEKEYFKNIEEGRLSLNQKILKQTEQLYGELKSKELQRQMEDLANQGKFNELKLLEEKTYHDNNLKIIEEAKKNKEELEKKANEELLKKETERLLKQQSEDREFRLLSEANTLDEVLTYKNKANLENLEQERDLLLQRQDLSAVEKENELARINSTIEQENRVVTAKQVGLNAVSNALTAFAGKSKKAFEAQKLLNIGEASMATATGAISAYKAMAGIPVIGPGLGIAAAGLVVATGTEKVRQIQEQKYSPKAELGGVMKLPNQTGDTSTVRVNNLERILTPRQNESYEKGVEAFSKGNMFQDRRLLSMEKRMMEMVNRPVNIYLDSDKVNQSLNESSERVLG